MTPCAVIWLVVTLHVFCAGALFIRSRVWLRDAIEEGE